MSPVSGPCMHGSNVKSFLWKADTAWILTGILNAVNCIWQEVTRVCMSEEAFLSFVNAWHVTSSLPLSDVMVLHIECCVENKFPSSHPPGLLWFQMKGGETIHGHFHTHTHARTICRIDMLACSLAFCPYFVCHLLFFVSAQWHNEKGESSNST